jgi:hypothetical protein
MTPWESGRRLWLRRGYRLLVLIVLVGSPSG